MSSGDRILRQFQARRSGRDFGIFVMAARLLNEPDGRVREEIEANIEQSGDQALHQELAPKAALNNRLLEGFAIFCNDAGGAARSQLLQIDFDDHGYLVDFLARFKLQANIFDRTDFDALELHRRADAQAVHRVVEIEHEFSGLPKQSSRTQGNHRDHQ